MLAEDTTQRVAKRSLAGSARASEYKRDFGASRRILHSPRQPIKNVLEMLLIAIGQHLLDVLAHQ